MIDITRAIEPGMATWPGDPPVTVEPHGAVDARVSVLGMGTHTGTHIDPPAHVIDGGATVDAIRLDALIGPCAVVEPDRLATATAARVLVRTGGDGSIGLDDARALIARGVMLVGIDSLSVEPGGDGLPVHRALLEAGVVILEGLDLHAAEPGDYTLVCLPLKIAGGDGAPARAILLEPGRKTD